MKWGLLGIKGDSIPLNSQQSPSQSPYVSNVEKKIVKIFII